MRHWKIRHLVTTMIFGVIALTCAVAISSPETSGPGQIGLVTISAQHKTPFKTMCAMFTHPVRCEFITHGGTPGSNVVFNRFDRQNPVEQDWNLVKAVNPATGKNLVTRSWPPAASWIRHQYRGKPVYMNVDVFARTCEGTNGVNDAPITHCHGSRSRGALWIVLGQIMSRAALLNIRSSSDAGVPVFLDGTPPPPGNPGSTLVGVAPGCGHGRSAKPCGSGEFWRRFGAS